MTGTFMFLLQYKLTVPKMGNVSDLLDVLSKETNIPKEKVSLEEAGCVELN